MAEWLMALVLKTSRLTSRRFESCPFRHASIDAFQKISPGGLYFLAAIFQERMFPLVAMFVVIVAVLLRNDFHLEFSCHRLIISYFVKKYVI